MSSHQNFLWGYLSRGSYKSIYSLPILPNTFLYGGHPQTIQQNSLFHYKNNWILLNFQNCGCSTFFLTDINTNFLGGYLNSNVIKTVDFSIVLYQRFFEEYDYRFHPMLLPQNNHLSIAERKKRIEIVKRAESVLFQRLEQRVLAAKSGRIPFYNELPKLDRKDVEYLSDKQLELYKEFFLNEKGHLDYQKIQVCFELFDNGEIQTNKYPGSLQPDSASDFLFAEFALHAIENNFKTKIWSELLKTFVKTQEIFIQVYRPNTISPPKLDDYHFSNFRYYKQVSDIQKQKLRKKYDCLSTSELELEYSKNLIRAHSSITSLQ